MAGGGGRCQSVTGVTRWLVDTGPAADRQWLISDHPDQAWVRGLWPDLPVDPRAET